MMLFGNKVKQLMKDMEEVRTITIPNMIGRTTDLDHDVDMIINQVKRLGDKIAELEKNTKSDPQRVEALEAKQMIATNNDHQHPFIIRSLTRDEGGGYTIEYPTLPGCMSDGETIEQAIANGNDAVECWLAVTKEETPDESFYESVKLWSKIKFQINNPVRSSDAVLLDDFHKWAKEKGLEK